MFVKKLFSRFKYCFTKKLVGFIINTEINKMDNESGKMVKYDSIDFW